MIRILMTVLTAMLLAATPAMAKDFLEIELKTGKVKIELLEDVAPKHVAQVKTIAAEGGYDGIAFHRVIDGFMAQTGDVEHGKIQADGDHVAPGGHGRIQPAGHPGRVLLGAL